MSTSSIFLLIVHGAVFITFRRKVLKSKRILAKENAELTTDNRRLKGQLQSLIAELGDD